MYARQRTHEHLKAIQLTEQLRHSHRMSEIQSQSEDRAGPSMDDMRTARGENSVAKVIEQDRIDAVSVRAERVLLVT